MQRLLAKVKGDKDHHHDPHGHHGPQSDPHHQAGHHQPDPHYHSAPAPPAYGHQTAQHGQHGMQLKKLRILCLHGYHGSSSILRGQMSSLASVMSPYADLIAVDAPSHQHGDFGWWHAVDRAYPDHRGDPGVVGARQYRGWERTKDWIVDLFNHQGPFDGVFGFSQGAALTGLLVGLRSPTGAATHDRPLVFNFAFMVGGFPAADPELAQLYHHSDSYDLPSVHIIGRSDGIVGAETSRRLAGMFKNPTVLEHGGGHVVASTPDVKAGVQAFLQFAQKHAATAHQDPHAGTHDPHHGAAAHDPHHQSHVHDPHAPAHGPADPHQTAAHDPHAAAHGHSAAGADRSGPAHAQSNGVLQHHAPFGGFPGGGDFDVSLWPNRRAPTMRVVFPKTRPSRPAPAMVIFRGGAYATCSGSGGGTDAWFADKGIVGVTVNYGTRETNTFWPNNYSDGARAMRLVRANAEKWGIDPKRIGLIGYSAGGSLASLIGTQPDLYRHPDDDLVGRFTARPDILILGYPVSSFVEGYHAGAYVGSVDNFFGNRDHTAQQRAQMSAELNVTPRTPPSFIWTTESDSLVPAAQTKLYAEACRKQGVPVVEKVYPDGPHGLGLAVQYKGEARRWTFEMIQWLANYDWLD